MKNIIRSTWQSLVVLCLCLALSGVWNVSVSYAAAKPCNTTDFEGFYSSEAKMGKVYAITKNALTYTDAKTLAVANGGHLVGPLEQAINDELTNRLVAPSAGKAWIGLRDPTESTLWSIEGQAAHVYPERFIWETGSNQFKNWSAGQPDNYCSQAEIKASPDRVCVGEHAAAMGADGKWSDEQFGKPLKALIEWDEPLSCASSEFDYADQADLQFDPATIGDKKLCSDTTKVALDVCRDANDGQTMCPLDLSKCPVEITPWFCGSGTLDPASSTCSKAAYISGWIPAPPPPLTDPPTPKGPDTPIYACDNSDGGAWSLSGSSCKMNACASSGAKYSPIVDKCVKWTCPTGSGSSGDACKQFIDADLPEDEARTDSHGLPVKWCSPNQCQTDTAGMIQNAPTTPGVDDKKNDGVVEADGSCLGELYIFNGKDSRCILADYRAMTGGIAKLVAVVVISAMTMGSGALFSGSSLLASATGTTTAALGSVTTSVANAAFTSILTSAVNLAIDASTTGIPEGWMLQAGISLASAVTMAYMFPTPGTKVVTNPDGTVSTTSTLIKDASGSDIMSLSKGTFNGQSVTQSLGMKDLGEMAVEQFSSEIKRTADVFGNITYSTKDFVVKYLSDGGARLLEISSTLTVPSNVAGLWALRAQQMSEYMKPALNAAAGLTSSYQVTRCCNPDPMSATCKPHERITWSATAAGQCHKIGDYCDTKFLFMCMAYARTSCCFGSLLGRVIHEQGRPQLQSFGYDGSWGDPKKPNCRGFTPEEFQMIDFSQIDLSEFIDSVMDRLDSIQEQVVNYMNEVADKKGREVDAIMRDVH